MTESYDCAEEAAKFRATYGRLAYKPFGLPAPAKVNLGLLEWALRNPDELDGTAALRRALREQIDPSLAELIRKHRIKI